MKKCFLNIVLCVISINIIATDSNNIEKIEDESWIVYLDPDNSVEASYGKHSNIYNAFKLNLSYDVPEFDESGHCIKTVSMYEWYITGAEAKEVFDNLKSRYQYPKLNLVSKSKSE